MTAKDKELAFRSSLWRLFWTYLINQYSNFITNEVDKTVKEAHKNGITDYNAWVDWVADGKKEVKKDAKPKRSGSGARVAKKQDG